MVTSIHPVKPLLMHDPATDQVRAITDLAKWARTVDPVFGTTNLRPTAGAYPGVSWFATDTLVESLWTGTAWINVTTVASGAIATRPASGAYVGAQWFATDTLARSEWDGTGWVIISEPDQLYTPGTSGITLGNGTVSGRSHRSDGYCDLAINFTFGSTTSFTGPVSFNAPAGITPAGDMILGQGMFFHPATTGLSPTPVYWNTGAPSSFNAVYINSLAAGTGFAQATTPYTWVSGDFISMRIRFRMSTRYS